MLNNMNITRARSTTLLTSNIVTTVKGYYINHVICFEFNILIMVSSTVLNTTTVLAYWKSSQLRKKTSYFLIMLLSFSDLGTVLGCSSMRSIILLRDMLGYERSSLTLPYIILMIVFFGMSYSILWVLIIERYLGIVHPLFHRNNVNKPAALKVIIVLWFIMAIVGFITVLDPKIGKFVVGTTISLNLTGLIVIYVKIFLTGGRTVVGNTSQQKAFLRKIKLAKSCLIAVGCGYVCLLPTAVMTFQPHSTFIKFVWWSWAFNLLHANPTLNSVIFFWRNPILRKEAKLILRQIFIRSH